ncbi:zinc finger protein 883-like [Maniola jurtina]|uniref:zinc finger protein 883-like n=1 Tax=Maniola jurtina TaxID=191418 RepID=UPI001E68767C|nr:zinc finger protein 883-like [Maniola jurtina]
MTHLRVKHPSDHICNQCGYSYLNELGLRSHLRRIHRLDKVEVRPRRYSTTTMPMYLRRQQVHVIHDALACEAPFRPHLQSVRLLLPERAGPPLALAQDSPLGQSRDSKYTSYMTHLRVKHPSDHICNQCGYSYLNELGLRSHLRRIHRLDKVEVRPRRYSTTTMPMYLRRQQVHVIHDALACEAPFRPHLQSVRLLLPERAGPPLALAQDSPLGQSRDSKYTSYTTHLRVKHPSDHICNQCGYSYLNELGLRSHLRRIHRLDKVENPDGPLCEECNVRFASSAAYEQHLKVSPKHFTPETRRVNQAVPPRCYSKGSGRHKRRRGDPADVITCEQCGIELKDFLRYTFHFKREHPDKNRTQFSPNNQKVLCELCGKHFQARRFHLKPFPEPKGLLLSLPAPDSRPNVTYVR